VWETESLTIRFVGQGLTNRKTLGDIPNTSAVLRKSGNLRTFKIGHERTSRGDGRGIREPKRKPLWKMALVTLRNKLANDLCCTNQKRVPWARSPDNSHWTRLVFHRQRESEEIEQAENDSCWTDTAFVEKEVLRSILWNQSSRLTRHFSFVWTLSNRFI